MFALLGAVIGLRYKASAILAATIFVVGAIAAGDLLTGQSLWMTLVHSLAAIVCLQAGYLVGLLIATFRRRRSGRTARH